MPRQTGIPAALKKYGVKYETVPGWRTRGSASFNPRGVVCHWTAGPRNAKGRPSLNVVTYGRPGLSGPLCQVYLDRNGVAVVVAAGRANHAGRGGYKGLSGNSSVFGIEAECGGDGDWTDAQRREYPKVVAALVSLTGRSEKYVCGHNEWTTRKIDIRDWPMPKMRSEVKAVLAGKGFKPGKGGGGGGSQYTVVNKTAPLGLYDRDPKNGHTRVADWQRDALGYTGKKADGFFGPDTDRDTRALQRQLGVKADGLVGESTMSAWEKAGKPKLGKSKPAPKPSPKPAPKVPGPGHAFPLPKGHYFGPKSGPNRSYSGFHNRTVKGKTDREWIKEWAKQLSRRGWSVGKGKTYLSRSGNDGLWGSEYAALCKAFQRSQGLSQDSLCGKRTWDEAFKRPVT